MKAILILFLAMLPVCTTMFAQCPEFLLSDLQNLQRAAFDQKQNAILDLGFDLRSEFTNQVGTFRNFSKCWRSTVNGKAVFEQLVWWNINDNTVTFLTLDEAHFKTLRGAILERQSTGTVSENPDFYVGKMFQYHFGGRRVDETEYYYVSIRFR